MSFPLNPLRPSRTLSGVALRTRTKSADVPGVIYTEESAELPDAPTGHHVYTLLAERAGYRSPGTACETDVGLGGEFRRGDVNTDGRANIADAINSLAYLFSGGPASASLWSPAISL